MIEFSPRAGYRQTTATVEEIPVGGQAITALYYAGAPDAPCLVHVHGKGGNAVSGPSRFLPQLLHDVAHLAVNMRCRDLAYTRYDIPLRDFTSGDPSVGGGYWEDLDEGRDDVTAAVATARARGHSRVVVVGHSSGGFYAGMVADQLDEHEAVVLLSPITDNRRALKWWFPDADERAAALKRARSLVAAGDGATLLPLSRWYWAISAASLVQRADEPEGIWPQTLAAAHVPVLLLAGGDESRAADWRHMAEELPNGRGHSAIIDGADHFYVGREDKVAEAVRSFVEAI